MKNYQQLTYDIPQEISVTLPEPSKNSKKIKLVIRKDGWFMVGSKLQYLKAGDTLTGKIKKR